MSPRPPRFTSLASIVIALLAFTAIGQGGALAQPAPPPPPPGGPLAAPFVEVDWAAARSERRQRIQARRDVLLDLVSRDSLSGTRLPVLVPDLPDMRKGGRVFAKEQFYSATVNLPTLTLEIFGTRVARPLPQSVGEALSERLGAADGDGFRFSRTETGVEVSFERFNCSYNVAVTCKDPERDPRCSRPDFLRGIARGMAFVGGEPEGGL